MSTGGLRDSFALPKDSNRPTGDEIAMSGSSANDSFERALASLAAAYQRSGAPVSRAELYRAIHRFGLDADSSARLDTKGAELGYVSPVVEHDEELGLEGAGDADASLDLLDVLYADIKQVPFLGHPEQMQMLRTIKAGQMASDALARSDVAPVDRDRLERMARDGRVALERFMTANFRLVIRVARELHKDGLDLLDVIQEGADGLLRAIALFDDSKGLHFSTYAYHWIRQRIERAYANLSLTIRLPVHAYQIANKALRARSILHNRLGREPSLNEIAEHIGQKPELLAVLWQARFISYLDAPISDGEEPITLADVLSTKTNPVETEAEYSEVRSRLENCIGRLSPREADIVRLRFGFETGRRFTLEEIGEKYNLTRERIRQLESKALRKLHKMEELHDLWRALDL